LERALAGQGHVQASTAAVPIIVDYLLIEHFWTVRLSSTMWTRRAPIPYSLLSRKAIALWLGHYAIESVETLPDNTMRLRVHSTPREFTTPSIEARIRHCREMSWPRATILCAGLVRTTMRYQKKEPRVIGTMYSDTYNEDICKAIEQRTWGPHFPHINVTQNGHIIHRIVNLLDILFEPGSVETTYDASPEEQIPLGPIGCIPATSPCNLVAAHVPGVDKGSVLVPLHELLPEPFVPPPIDSITTHPALLARVQNTDFTVQHSDPRLHSPPLPSSINRSLKRCRAAPRRSPRTHPSSNTHGLRSSSLCKRPKR
jgi:hypothetical protein